MPLKLVFTSAFKLCKRMRSPDAHVKYFASIDPVKEFVG